MGDTMSNIKSPKKLIEVALPLDDINAEAAREKSIRHGHPSTLHLWWARRPLAAARAVLFAQMVNDPGGERGYMAGLTKQQAAEKVEKTIEAMAPPVQVLQPVSEPIEPPTTEAKLYEVAFKVVGTIVQIKALKEFLEKGAYQYEQQ